jgi:hypothetical protein
VLSTEHYIIGTGLRHRLVVYVGHPAQTVFEEYEDIRAGCVATIVLIGTRPSSCNYVHGSGEDGSSTMGLISRKGLSKPSNAVVDFIAYPEVLMGIEGDRELAGSYR